MTATLTFPNNIAVDLLQALIDFGKIISSVFLSEENNEEVDYEEVDDTPGGDDGSESPEKLESTEGTVTE